MDTSSNIVEALFRERNGEEGGFREVEGRDIFDGRKGGRRKYGEKWGIGKKPKGDGRNNGVN
jgi:hypothetical protein